MPGYLCFYEAIELSLFRSKSPEWLGLYSTPKLCAILFLIFLGIIILSFISPILSKKLVEIPFKEKFEKLSPLKIYLVLLIFLRLCLIGQPCSIGEDLAQQVLTSQQYAEGVSIAPNLISSPDSNDLSTNEFVWLLRPLGGAWIPLAGLLLGFTLGTSIHLSFFTIYI